MEKYETRKYLKQAYLIRPAQIIPAVISKLSQVRSLAEEAY